VCECASYGGKEFVAVVNMFSVPTSHTIFLVMVLVSVQDLKFVVSATLKCLDLC
jgi:hypothetical protein